MRTNRFSRSVGIAAWVVAWVGVVLAPIHALSRFATAAGTGDLESPVVRAWAEPAARLLRPLLSWSDVDTVYVAYGRVWLPLLLVATVCAFVIRSKRDPHGGERWAWWIALTGYVVATVSVFGDYFTPWMDQSFAFVGIPGLLISMLGSTMLGIVLLRRGYRPRATGWLLTVWFPLFFLLSSVIAMGAALLPMLWAWGLAGRALSRSAMPAVPVQSVAHSATPADGAATWQ